MPVDHLRSCKEEPEWLTRERNAGALDFCRILLSIGKGGKGGKVKSRKQAIAIGLSKARKKGKRVARKKR